mmetsp:Transcript_149320/g.271389  ORF Transcript_149320/g.271389 Transcript_149320/m.271389 type:complete len:102 (-) Transcript_149320:73-378(-)
MFDASTYDRMLKEIPKAKLIAPSVVSERLKINGSLARSAISHLEEKGLIAHVGEKHHAQRVYTRNLQADELDCALAGSTSVVAESCAQWTHRPGQHLHTAC